MLFKDFYKVKEIISDYLNFSSKVSNYDDDVIAILEDIENNFISTYKFYFPEDGPNIDYNKSFNFRYQCSLFGQYTLLIHFNCFPIFAVYRPFVCDNNINGYLGHFLDIYDWVIISH